MSNAKVFLILAAVSGFIAVSLGAFGAHGLKAHMSEQAHSTWQTAVLYQFFHTLALLAVALLLKASPGPALAVTGWLFASGMLLFSGSLYGLALGAPSWLGPVTPIGGLCFLAGWISLLSYAVRY